MYVTDEGASGNDGAGKKDRPKKRERIFGPRLGARATEEGAYSHVRN
jgi:hypothetical protein